MSTLDPRQNVPKVSTFPKGITSNEWPCRSRRSLKASRPANGLFFRQDKWPHCYQTPRWRVHRTKTPAHNSPTSLEINVSVFGLSQIALTISLESSSEVLLVLREVAKMPQPSHTGRTNFMEVDRSTDSRIPNKAQELMQLPQFEFYTCLMP
ncbi:hypothetical protein Sjap_004650 [Stephania japonica]|uniref:Uncharacterized protein n=1 Tax=Stephania japonica TaxID=461633 RepID=A0AAP0K2Q8_9MAGN